MTGGIELSVDGLVDGFASSAAPTWRWRWRDTAAHADAGHADAGHDTAGHDDARARAVSVALEMTRAGQTQRLGVEPDSAGLTQPWPAAPLASREQVSVRAIVADAAGAEHRSDALALVGGVLEQWTAPFIAADTPQDDTAQDDTPALLRRAFSLAGSVRQATLFVSAFGAATPSINGVRVGDHELAPGWTSYGQRVGYDVYDVTEHVQEGPNVLGIDLHGAWLTERYGFRDAAARFYEGRPHVSVHLVADHGDGVLTELVTDGDWRGARGGAVRSSLYRGEEYDARAQPEGWDLPGFDDSAWARAVAVETGVTPEPRLGPPVRVTETRHPVVVRDDTATGTVLLDFGQNLVGRLRLDVHAPEGARLVLRHAEVLEGDGLATRPLRNADATDVFVSDGRRHSWAPRGTFHGFRYAEISGWPEGAPPIASSVVAEVLGTDLRRIGGLRTSHPLLQQLHENIVWGARGNFLSIPTDCPQRDERLGWTGDVQVFSPAAAFLFDCSDFLRSWLRDVRIEQRDAGGIVPMTVPGVIPQVPGQFEPIAAWGDAITIVPHVLRESTGDDEVVVENLDAMLDWLAAVDARTGDALLWEDGRQFGDWLDPDAPPDQPGRAKTDPDIVATAYRYRSTRLTAEAARLAGRDELGDRLEARADRIRSAFVETYVTPAGRMSSDAPAAYALAIVFGLVEGARRQRLGDRLAELVRRRAYRIPTGFAGTPILCDALVSTGHVEAAGRMLLQTENPSWLYPVTMGATTVWERWDSMLEDGSINPGQMTSFNHFALGAVADWLHRGLGGLAPAEPGYATVRFAPVVIDGVDDVAVWHDSPHGRIETSWVRRDGHIEFALTLPAGVTASVELPGISTTVAAGEHRWRVAEPAGTTAAGAPSLDGPMTDVLADPEAYRIVMDELTGWDAQRGAALRRSIVWTEGRRLRDPLDKVPVAVMDRIEERLRERHR